MGLTDKIVNTTINAFRSKDTYFLKENSDLQNQFDALSKLNTEYPNNKALLHELMIVKKGLDGENAVAYHLSKANIGMYVLRDVKVRYYDLTAQIDFIIVTPVFTYFVECKNLNGNITVNEKGDFIRTYFSNGKKVRKGFPSPIQQVETQRDVIRKIWESNASSVQKLLAPKYFNYYRKVLVVAANQDTILDTNKAPKEIKEKVIRVDSLLHLIQNDIKIAEKSEFVSTENEIEKIAKYYLDLCIQDTMDYYSFYKNKFCQAPAVIPNSNMYADNTLRDRLIALRTARKNAMNIPAYYVFTNNELDQLLKQRPTSMEALIKSNILPPIKVKTHGDAILAEINKKP